MRLLWHRLIYVRNAPVCAGALYVHYLVIEIRLEYAQRLFFDVGEVRDEQKANWMAHAKAACRFGVE